MKSFLIFNKELEIDSGLLLFAILREKINAFATEAAEEFDIFYGNCTNMKYFLEHAEIKALELYTHYLEETVSFLIKLNIYDISNIDIKKESIHTILQISMMNYMTGISISSRMKHKKTNIEPYAAKHAVVG